MWICPSSHGLCRCTTICMLGLAYILYLLFHYTIYVTHAHYCRPLFYSKNLIIAKRSKMKMKYFMSAKCWLFCEHFYNNVLTNAWCRTRTSYDLNQPWQASMCYVLSDSKKFLFCIVPGQLSKRMFCQPLLRDPYHENRKIRCTFNDSRGQ